MIDERRCNHTNPADSIDNLSHCIVSFVCLKYSVTQVTWNVNKYFWHRWKESNPLRAVLETAALPLSYTDIFGSLTRARTWDILINSQTLYQLSYQEMVSVYD